MSTRLPSWLTPDGIDMNRLPFDAFIRQAVSKDPAQFGSACRLLESMASRGRTEAGIFLLGLLSFYREDLPRLEKIAQALQLFPTAQSAQLLFGELHRLQWSNTTRRYLNAVVATLTSFPPPLVLAGFSALACDPNQGPSARRRYRDILDQMPNRPIHDGV